MPSVNDEIIDTLKHMPDLSVHDLSELLPHINKGTIYAAASYLRRTGDILISGKGVTTPADGIPRPYNRYSLNPNPVPVAPKRKLKSPTPVGYETQIAELKAQLAELEEWKANAIGRFPDLAVDPLVLRARKLVAEEFVASGDNAMADQVRRGLKDGTPMMRVTVRALEEGE